VEFKTRLKAARARSGKSLRIVARDAGCSHAYLSRIENGRDTPSANLVSKLAKALDSDVDELCALAGCVPPDVEKKVLGYGKAFWSMVRDGRLERVFRYIQKVGKDI